ncbi:MAG: imidazole glycerol phosphate synthase subunit HisH, partial [Patescibacteria group bacterium]
MIAIVDYGMGNVGSVKNALTFLGRESVISNREEDLEEASHIILPGVGAFKEGMDKLKEVGVIDILKKEVFV